MVTSQRSAGCAACSTCLYDETTVSCFLWGGSAKTLKAFGVPITYVI